MTASALQELALELLDAEGQTEIDLYLEAGNEEHAKEYLLGYLDGQMDGGHIGTEEAADYYRRLGMDPEQASSVRQTSDSQKNKRS